MNPKTRVLVIDDDAGLAGGLKKELDAEGYDTAVVLRGDDGLSAAKQEAFDVVITDLKLPGLSGLDLIDQLHAAKPRLPIILMTAYSTSRSAIEATRRGVCEYVLKPFEMSELLALVAKAAACNEVPSRLLDPGMTDTAPPGIVGQSKAMQALFKAIGYAAQSSVNVLIRGETGTGKELVAQAIHEHSSRKNQPFVAVNCTAIPDTLLESELFGHEHGAFTGAVARRLGRFEQAGEGTLFLDEIGDLNPGTQAKLLRVLQEKCIQRVGGNQKISVDARILAATHRDLEAAMAQQQVREDLFYRLAILIVRVPPLRERLEDIPHLVRHFLARFSAELRVATPSIQVEAVEFLQHQPWPGNVRELENVVFQALMHAGNHSIGLAHVRAARATTQRPIPVQGQHQTIADYIAGLLAKAQQGQITDCHALMIEEMERALFTLTIQLAHGNQARAAHWLGVTRTTLRVKLAHFGLHAATPGEASQTETES